MSTEASNLFEAVAVGTGATLLMDIWNFYLKRAFGIASLNYCFLGRWLRYMPEGTFRHASITAALPKSHECIVGWAAHYTTGILFSVVFVMAFASADWLARPTLPPALLYGIVTVVFPFFILQPALGLGVASSRTAKPGQARLKSVGTHAIFGLGMYLCAAGLSWATRST